MIHLADLYHYRDLLWLWTGREVRVRYKQSVLGVTWAVIQPLALTLVFTLVFSRLMQVDTGGVPYPVFAYSALVPWTFFATSLAFAIPSLVNNLNLVGKIYFPREILPLANIGAALLDLNDPEHVIGRLKKPLIEPLESEREGYVPNVVYTCGAMLHRDLLVVPYAMSDTRSGIATLHVDELIEHMLADGP